MNPDIRTRAFLDALSGRILILDGAMGTMLRAAGHSDPDFQVLLSRPEAIAAIHDAYIGAGADIIETCTFNANAASLAGYGMADRVRDINLRAARIAREAASRAGRAVWVAGSVGPGPSGLTYAAMERSYREQTAALIEGGVDLLFIETVYDPVNARAALDAARRAMEDAAVELPVAISATLGKDGRLPAGQSLADFIDTASHASPAAVMLNCGFGPDHLVAYLDELRDLPAAVGIYPNAGLPDEAGHYPLSPEAMARALRPAMAAGKINIAGGCCGTTPAHIRAIADAARGCPPRPILLYAYDNK